MLVLDGFDNTVSAEQAISNLSEQLKEVKKEKVEKVKLNDEKSETIKDLKETEEALINAIGWMKKELKRASK